AGGRASDHAGNDKRVQDAGHGDVLDRMVEMVRWGLLLVWCGGARGAGCSGQWSVVGGGSWVVGDTYHGAAARMGWPDHRIISSEAMRIRSMSSCAAFSFD